MPRKSILIFVCALFCLISSVQAQQKIYLVSVGVADYPGTRNDLHLCAHDAEVIQWLYQKNKKAETLLLTNEQATCAAVCSAMQQEFAKAGPDDAVVLFFSGHGMPGCFVCYDGFLNYALVRNAMAQSSARHKMIFADACFSGKMRQNGQHNPSVPESEYKNLDVLLFLSSRATETSIEMPIMKNGFFTAYLQRGLRGGADVNGDRVITAKELFNFVSTGVAKMSKGTQHPVMWGKFNDSMPVMSW